MLSGTLHAAVVSLAFPLAAMSGSTAMAQRWNPVADERAQVLSSCGKARFTVLTPRLLRMEWAPDGGFEDRPSQAFVNRRLDVPPFRVERGVRSTRVITDRLALTFTSDGLPFHPGNLAVTLGVGERPVTWTPGSSPAANLGGTARTLDGFDGPSPVEPGLISRDGWAVVDDSDRLVFDPAPGTNEAGAHAAGPRHPDLGAWDWMVARDHPGAQDWYFFGYAHDYPAALQDFTKVAGSIPLPPRYVLGAWWSRYWAYSDQDLKNLVGEFREHDVPLDVLVIDMDWHTGPWTGYTWNKKFFPDPAAFLKWTDQHGLQITLNLHPADGVARREDAFPAMCRAMGLDPQQTEHVPFDCTSKRYMQAYFRELHYPLEQMGVDFWWMDWQQGTRTSVAGLDPLWWLNHLHWKDLEERQRADFDPQGVRHGRRPLIFSRWGGLGNHRYPIGFSGDTYSTWASLAWQPEFTAMAGNVGYAYWSHDIGGHQPGPVDPELYTRWVQYGALSPVLRTHTSKNPQGERRIWASPDRAFKAMRAAFALRYRLIPYMYTAARRCFDQAVPLCRPLYHQWPELDRAYTSPEQYMFGDDLLAAPVVRPGDPASGCAAVRAWLPPGVWTGWYSGQEQQGPCEVEALVPIEETPLFVRAGAIIPQAPAMKWSGEKPLDPMTLVFWPGADEGCTRIYEDDGESAGYEQGASSWTGVSQRRRGQTIRARIEAAEGRFAGMSERRGWELRFVDRWPARAVRIEGREATRLDPGAPADQPGWSYDASKCTIVVRLAPGDVFQAREVEIDLDDADEGPLREGLHGRLRTFEALGELLGAHPPGEHAPGVLGEAASGALRARLIESRGRHAQGEFGPDARWALAMTVSRSGAPETAKGEAICRLIGLTSSMSVESDGERAGVIRTRGEARLLRGVGLLDAQVRTAITPTRPWTLLGREVGGDGASGVELASWSAEPTPQIAGLRASVEVERGGERLGVSFERAVFPSINGWWVVGPFDCAIKEAMVKVFEPERSPDVSRTYQGRAGEAALAWKRVERRLRPGEDPGAEFVVDLHAVFGERRDDAVAYALTTLVAPTAREAVLSLGSDDGVVVWLNGQMVHSHDVMRGYGSHQDRVAITLRAGRNTLLLKITQAQGAWCFGAHVQEKNGNPMGDVAVTLE